ncbi:hypothetical protein D3C71_1647050 [compost metagenome]
MQHLVARAAQRLGRRIQVQAVAALVLHLGQQDGLALERGRTGYPVAFRQHADDFRMRMLADLAQQRLAVVLGHPVLGLDEFSGVDARVERALALHLFGTAQGLGVVAAVLAHGVHGLGVHSGVLPWGWACESARALVDHAAGLAHQRAFDGVGVEHLDMA